MDQPSLFSATEKTCYRCGTVKSLTEFHRHAAMRDGHLNLCKPCRSAANRERALSQAADYRRRNREALSATSKRWRSKNLERTRAQSRRYYAENREKWEAYYAEHGERLRAAARDRYANDPEKHKQYSRRTRARRMQADGHCGPQQLAARSAVLGGRCWMCGGAYEHADHVVPIFGGGTDWPANLRPACAPCNIGKRAKRIPLDEQRRMLRERFRLNGTLP